MGAPRELERHPRYCQGVCWLFGRARLLGGEEGHPPGNHSSARLGSQNRERAPCRAQEKRPSAGEEGEIREIPEVEDQAHAVSAIEAFADEFPTKCPVAEGSGEDNRRQRGLIATFLNSSLDKAA